MDKLRAQKYFLKVAETGSFSGAAKKLGVPASSVSRRIQDLEKELGTVLIHRSTRVVHLTELGEVYRAHIEPAISALQNADEVVGQQSRMPSGTLRINALPGYGRFCLMPVLRKFNQQYPDMVLDVELTDRVLNLANNETDIAIRATGTLPERSVAHRLSDNRFVLIASPTYLNAHGTPRTAAELQQHPTLLYRGPNGILGWQARFADGWSDLPTTATFISNQGEAILEEALDNKGIGLVPEWGIRRELASGELIELRLEDAGISVSRNEDSGIFLLYHKPKYSLSKIRAAVDFLVSELAEQPT